MKFETLWSLCIVARVCFGKFQLSHHFISFKDVKDRPDNEMGQMSETCSV